MVQVPDECCAGHELWAYHVEECDRIQDTPGEEGEVARMWLGDLGRDRGAG